MVNFGVFDAADYMVSDPTLSVYLNEVVKAIPSLDKTILRRVGALGDNGSDDTIDDDPNYEDTLICVHPIESSPDRTVIFTCSADTSHEYGSCEGVPRAT